MTSTTDVPRKGDRVRVSWKDGPVARTAEFTVEDYSPGIESAFPYLSRHPEIAYKNALGRGFFVIGPDYTLEILERAKPELIDTVPGMVLTGSMRDFRFIILPDGYYDVANGVVNRSDGETWDADYYTVVFDPRNAEALDFTLGIKPGDYVKRVSEADGVKETVEFEVHYVDTTGLISAKYGTSYSPVGFEVQNREVHTRLPAGTIAREADLPDRLFLRTKGGFVRLWDGSTSADGAALEGGVSGRYTEVIYLP